MNRQFKHKTLGDIATYDITGMYKISSKFTVSYIESRYIENSNDWEEINKKPLFVTEDGVEIYDLIKDRFYYVRTSNSDYYNPLWKVSDNVLMEGDTFTYEPQYEKYFSSKQAAENYIIINKPCLSYADIQFYIGSPYTYKRIMEVIKKRM